MIASVLMRMQIATALSIAAVSLVASGCKDDKPSSPHDAAPAVSATATASASASATASAAPSASAAPAVKIDCPKGSTGEGSFAKPCEAKGRDRMMVVTWTGKTDDKGPHFSVTNKSPNVILYGKIAVYFYDKAGKQLEVKDPAGGKPKPYQSCSGNMFSGVMKAGEKAVLTFSCVPQKSVPEGTAAVEAEMEMVGFTDASEKKIEYYWRNSDLAPDTRPKGGAK